MLKSRLNYTDRVPFPDTFGLYYLTLFPVVVVLEKIVI